MNVIVKTPKPAPPPKPTFDLVGLTRHELVVLRIAIDYAVSGQKLLAPGNVETAKSLYAEIFRAEKCTHTLDAEDR